jgi:hypothetical protein
MKHLAAALLIAAAAVFAPAPASATTILTFGQTLGGSPIVGTNNGLGSTTISGVNVLIDVTQIDAALVTPLAAFLNLTATSTAAATLVSGFVVEPFSGMFTITSLPGGLGINYLSATFTDAVFGAGASLTLSVADPPNSADFTSDVIADLGLPTGISFSFASVHPPVGIHNGSLSSFTSSVSGTFSGSKPQNQTPEPGSLVLVGLAMLGLAASLRRKSGR